MYRLGRAVILSSAALGLAALYLLYNMNPDNIGYLLPRRLPVLGAIVLGAWAAGVSALSFQTVANNHIITPGIMGLEGLFVLAHTVLIMTAPGFRTSDPLPAFGFALSVLLLYSLVLIRQLRRAESGVEILLLTGIVASTLFTSANAFLQKVMDPNEFSLLQSSTLGSIGNVNPRVLAAGATLAIVCTVMLYAVRNRLDVLALGKDTAVSLGVRYRRTVRIVILICLSLTGISTAVIGPFPYLGLVIASVTRAWFRDHRHARLFPAAFMTGFIVILGGHLVVERLLKNRLTLPVFLNLAGGIVFLILVTRRSNSASS